MSQRIDSGRKMNLAPETWATAGGSLEERGIDRGVES
jgi:hypothetical protein